MIPFGLGGTICDSLRVMVQEGDEVPMLFPIRLCYAHGMVLDTTQHKVCWSKKHDSYSDLVVEHSGHISISLLDFPSKGWLDPNEEGQYLTAKDQVKDQMPDVKRATVTLGPVLPPVLP